MCSAVAPELFTDDSEGFGVPVRETISKADRLSPDVGRTYLGCRQDRAIPPFAQRKLARLLHAQVQQIDGGHDGMVSNPVGTAAALNQIAPESARTDLKPRSPRRR